MNPEQWQQVKEVFAAALEYEPAQRAAFLARVCAQDEAIRREVESLLAAQSDAPDFMDTPAVAAVAGGLLAAQTRLAAGRHFGHFEIISLLGEGGMGEVYLAHDARLGRKIALKLLPTSFTNDADRVRRFAQEARAASALNHPNILTIYEIGLVDGRHFIATEYVAGETLRTHMGHEAKLPLAAALDVATQVTTALAAAHEAGVVHRDIKPENVMVRRDQLVKVLDFGLAKLTEKKEEGVVDQQAPTRALVRTTPGMIMGTVAYMSPEQARGQEVDARTDIFSLGVMLYEMLTGSLPFTGETTTDMLAAILKTEPAAPCDLNQALPAEIDKLVNKTLAKDRAARYQTAQDLLVDLRRLKTQGDMESESVRTASADRSQSENVTQLLVARTTADATGDSGRSRKPKLVAAIALAVLLLTALGLGYWFFAARSAHADQIESIAVLPFANESGNSEVEYLSDGMTESLINSLSQLPKLSVKARSSVFRYKGKEVEPQQIAAALSVQAILSGRFVQRGDDLALYLSLIDARNGNQLWGEQYHHKLGDLVTLQSELARDVSQRLRARLSGADERKVTKDYTANAEAYQLYLKGRYHVFKLTPPEVQQGISYLQQAIEIDPAYALAYVGLSEAYRSLALAGEMNPNESLTKARAAAQKAIEFDDALAEAHGALAVTMFWYDWNWNEAEQQYKRALELNPNVVDVHLFYAHLLSNTGRHAEALAEVKRARELDPLAPFASALEGQFLVHAGRSDEALARLQETFELAPNFWFPHVFASSAYIEKGMYREAIAEAQRAKELGPNQTASDAYGGYALAKSGRRDEAQAVLAELQQLTTTRFVPPYHIALIYNGLGETDKALDWLEQGCEQRDPKMAFLQVEPKWNNLRADPRFQALLRRVGFTL